MVYQLYRLQKDRWKMIDFVECGMAMQDFLMILFEICLVLELILLLVRITCFPEKENRNGSGCLCCFFYVYGRSDE